MIVDVDNRESFDIQESYDYIEDFLFSLYEKLSKETRDTLEDTMFGIPETRSYPMHDIEHVKIAIRMFNFCNKDKEKSLAKNIIKFIELYNIDPSTIKVGDNNRFKKYWIKKYNKNN